MFATSLSPVLSSHAHLDPRGFALLGNDSDFVVAHGGSPPKGLIGGGCARQVAIDEPPYPRPDEADA